MAKGSGSNRSSKSPQRNIFELAEKEYYDYTHAGGYIQEKNGAYSHMSVLLEDSPKDMTLYRGGDTQELTDMFGFDLNDYKSIQGKEIQSKYYKSTASIEKYATDYATDVFDSFDADEEGIPQPFVMKMNVKKGTPIINRSKHTDISDRAAGAEYTLGKNVKFKVNKISRQRYFDSNSYVYYLDVDVTK